MSSHPPGDRFARIDRADASRLLRLGLDPAPPADDGALSTTPEAVAGLLAVPPVPLPGPAGLLLIEGQASLPLLRGLKSAAQARFAPTWSATERLAAGIWYHLAIAAACVHHGVVITSQPVADLRTAWTGLSRRLPEPWGTLLNKAVARLDAATPT